MEVTDVKTNIEVQLDIKTIMQLPPEVLEKIFSHLSNPLDLLNAMHACKKWQACLFSRRSCIYLQNVFPMVVKQLSTNDVLACRVVCKPLQKSIDELLEGSIQLAGWERLEDLWQHPICVKPDVISRLALRYDFDNFRTDCPQTQSFVQHMEKHTSRKPRIVGRSITCEFAEKRGIRGFYDENVMSLLDQFGYFLKSFTHSVQFCVSTVNTEDDPAQDVPLVIKVFKNFPKILGKLPNLLSLRLNWSMCISNQSACALVQPDECPQFLPRILKFPKLPYLTMLDYNFSEGYSFPLFQTLLAVYGNQLSTLICTEDLIVLKQFEVNTMCSFLPNLKFLKINRVTANGVKKLIQMDSNSAKLRVERLQLNGHLDTLNGLDIVLLMNSFSESLKRFDINLFVDLRGILNIPFDSDIMSCELVSLEHVSIQMRVISHDLFGNLLLQKCPNIKLLDVHNNYDNMNSADLTSRMKEMADSYLNLCPTLRQVRIRLENLDITKVFH